MVEEGRIGSSWSRVLVPLLLPSPSIVSSGSVDMGGGGRRVGSEGGERGGGGKRGRGAGMEGDGSGDEVWGK